MIQPEDPRCVDPYAHRFEFDVRDTVSTTDINMIERLRWCWQCRATVDDLIHPHRRPSGGALMPVHNQQYVSPPPVHMCRTCGKKLADTLIEQGVEYHVGPCDPSVVMDQRNAGLKQQGSSRSSNGLTKALPAALSRSGDRAARRWAIRAISGSAGRWRDATGQFPGSTRGPRSSERGRGTSGWRRPSRRTRWTSRLVRCSVRRWQTEMDIRLDDLLHGHSDPVHPRFRCRRSQDLPVSTFLAKIKKNGLLPYSGRSKVTCTDMGTRGPVARFATSCSSTTPCGLVERPDPLPGTVRSDDCRGRDRACLLDRPPGARIGTAPWKPGTLGPDPDGAGRPSPWLPVLRQSASKETAS